MLKFFNSFGKKAEVFKPVDPKVVTIFTCGPSVYQRAHIGNMRTFLFEDIVVRYLEYLGFSVKRGMSITDVEDKAVNEALKEHLSLKKLTDRNIKKFIGEIEFLKMKVPDYLPRASEHVTQSVDIILQLLDRRIAYWHNGNVYFDPLKFKGFGKLFGLDMSRWPKQKRRFHKDTYPGIQWNLGDFILWHGYKHGDDFSWETKLGKGRPAWNVQDPSMIVDFFEDTLSIYCGGIDNLYRHHDYNIAVLESVRKFPMARYWLHCRHLLVNGYKMSKSKGNIVYVDLLSEKGYNPEEQRFFLIYGQYGRNLNYSERNIAAAAEKLRDFRGMTIKLKKKAAKAAPAEGDIPAMLKKVFNENMDNDLDVKGAFDGLQKAVSRINVAELKPAEAAGIVKVLKEIDSVLQVIF